jgi:LysM repeat protein
MVNVVMRTSIPRAIATHITSRLFSGMLSPSCVDMWKCLLLGWATVATVLAQTAPTAIDFANLREDVRMLTQRVGDLTLKLEQLERENGELRQRVGTVDRASVSLEQLKDAIEDVNRSVRANLAASKKETQEHVNAQIEKLGKQVNAALDSIAKAPGRGAMTTSFAEDYPKEGISYVVAKGDTLAVIAKKTGAKQQDIINANKLADPSRIVVGQTLFIPGGK